MIVHLLWHVGHQNEAGPDGSTVHMEDGSVYIDEQDGDDVKLLGVYSTEEKAAERMRHARLSPGFKDEPECFVLEPHLLDEDEWSEGFVRVPHGE